MATTRIGAVIDQLVTVTIPGALPAATVVDGPYLSDDTASDIVYVGISDATAAEHASAESRSQWRATGKVRDEDLIVHGLASSWRGGDVLKTARDAALANVAAIEAAVIADPTLGGVVLYVRNFSVVQLLQAQSADGARARLFFDLIASARI